MDLCVTGMNETVAKMESLSERNKHLHDGVVSIADGTDIICAFDQITHLGYFSGSVKHKWGKYDKHEAYLVIRFKTEDGQFVNYKGMPTVHRIATRMYADIKDVVRYVGRNGLGKFGTIDLMAHVNRRR